MLNHSTESSEQALNPAKDPASRPKGMIYWYREECLKVVRAWVNELKAERTMTQREAHRIASIILQYPSPRRLERVMETLEKQGIIEFYDDVNAQSYSEQIKMRLLTIPYEIALEINR